MTRLSGAVVGAVVLTAVEMLRQLEDSVGRSGISDLGLAIALLVILIVRPAGITGGNEIRLPARATWSQRKEPEQARRLASDPD
jgi:branched-chain amino acid transport system permease protein